MTGLGAVTPIGNDVATSWESALAGRSGVDWIQTFDASAFPVRVAAEVKGFDPTTVASPKEVRKLERYVLLSLGAAHEAIADAGIELDVIRTGIVFARDLGLDADRSLAALYPDRPALVYRYDPRSRTSTLRPLGEEIRP